MKNHAFAGGQLAALSRFGANAGFFLDRKQAVDLAPMGRQAAAAYIWRKVLLRARARRA